jgi:N-acetylmuramidase-like protein/putative peptidoglycan binding protein
MFEGKGRPLSGAGLRQAGMALGVGLPSLWAVMTVETRGCGFLRDRRPVILFERHWFSKLTGREFDEVAPDLSNSTAGGYGKNGAFQHERLERGIKLNRRAALESTSWGLGQVMGFNAAAVGFTDVEAMVNATCESEDLQFQAMIKFIEANGLATHLKTVDWVSFARLYNGPEFQRNMYDKKLAMAHARFTVGPLPDLRVRAAQLYLSFLGLDPSGVDGWFGEKTQKMIVAFQASKDMPRTGRLDDATFSALETAAMS